MRRRRGCRNSQAKGPDSDETLESNDAPKKQPCPCGGIFQVMDRGTGFISLCLCFLLLCRPILLCERAVFPRGGYPCMRIKRLQDAVLLQAVFYDTDYQERVMNMEQKTPLYDCHVKAGGKIVPFAGYLLPVQYETGVIAEHMAVRTKCGLFDVSHMGEVTFRGPDALNNLQMLLTNDFSGMAVGQVRYSPMCNEEGGIVDDLIVYRMGEESYMVVVNAANREKDVAWMRAHLTGDVTFEDISDTVAQLALQGPCAETILSSLARKEEIPFKYYTYCSDVMVGGVRCIVSRTGYTGEDGFELYCAAKDAEALWNTLLHAGAEEGLIPCGLGARDTLRLEAAMPLYGHEMDDAVSPLETGLGFAVKMGKEAFIGKDAIQRRGKPQVKRVGLEVTGRGIAREHQDVFFEGEKIGHTTSGTYCPYLEKPRAMAQIDAGRAEAGTEVAIDIRGRKVAAKVVALPFYKISHNK